MNGFRIGLLAAFFLVGCSASQGSLESVKARGTTTTTATSDKNFFETSVGPNLTFCRSCHIPGAPGDVEKGRRFMLSSNPLEDFEKFKISWEALNNGVEANRILTMNSGELQPAESHTGGSTWPKGSQAYEAVKTLLMCWNDPQTCSLTGTDPVTKLPLLGSKHARHIWDSVCEGESETSTKPLPQDPRSKVVRDFNKGNAVYFNAYWEDCHVNLPTEKHAKTCGEFIKRRNLGRKFIMDELPAGSTTEATYHDTYKKWGLSEYPTNFDQLYTLRYGLNQAPFDNPYTMPDGKTGQLPLGLRKMADGNIGTAACFQCHGGQIGVPTLLKLENIGLGNNNYDVVMNGQDGSPINQMPGVGTVLASTLPGVSVETLFNIGIKQRGQNNAVGAFELLITLLDADSLGVNPNFAKTMIGQTGPQDDLNHPLAHTQDTPPWWNMGSRPRKFFDAGVSNDSTRIIMAAGPDALTADASGKPYRTSIEKHDQDLEAFFLSLKSPVYPQGFCTHEDGTPVANAKPKCIDRKLAETGAVLFHSKNLWAVAANKDKPKPLGGNGSCASCHGAYSPRYVNDKSYLVDPVMEGVAGHISPLEVINTDPARSDMLTPTLRERWDTLFWGYPDNVNGWTDPASKDPVTELLDDMYPNADSPLAVPGAPSRPMGVCSWQKEVIGYQAPPLYGVWATAPYFHNGSVPTVYAVLDSKLRKPIWQRKLQTLSGVTGFDQRLETAYDFDAMGWKSDEIVCDQMPGTQQMNCSPAGDQGPSFVQMLQNVLNSAVSWSGLVGIPDPAPGSIDKRLIYDTRILGNGNGGHDFSDVLTDTERQAVIEYLKTL